MLNTNMNAKNKQINDCPEQSLIESTYSKYNDY